MPVLRYYDGTKFVDLPGVQGPPGPPGAPATPGMVAQAWGPAANYTGSQPVTLLATGLKAGRNYLVSGYAIATNVSAANAQARFALCLTSAGAAPGPNVGVWIKWQAANASDVTAPTVWTPGTSGSFVFTPPSDGDYSFTIFSVGTANAFQFAPNQAAIFVMDLAGAPGPQGPTGPAGPAGGGSVIASARAWRSAAQTLTGTDVVIAMDTEQWDTQNAYNTSTGIFTCPQAGKYKVSGQVATAANTAANQWIVVSIYKNGVSVSQDYEYIPGASGQYIFGHVDDTLDLAVGDTVGIYCRCSATLGITPGVNNCFIAIDLLSGTGPQGPPGPVGPPAGYMSLVYYQTIPAPQVMSNPYTVTHNLGTRSLLVQAWDSVTNQVVQVQWQTVDINRLTVSVAQNMPNPVNVVVMGTAQTPTPIAAGDLATKAYVDAKTTTLPAPVTSGSGVQSFTDALGDVWVAVNGVRGGNWYRARDVIHCRVGRNAAYTMPTSNAAMPWDTVVNDPYSMFTGGPNYRIVPPVAGLYLCKAQLQCTPTAANQWINIIMYSSVTGTLNTSNVISGGTFAPIAQTVSSHLLAAGEGTYVYAAAVAALAGVVGPTVWNFQLDYLGTG